jgi:DNA-binding winged helix-turn-helix (wHTH) protein/tetratricopeptide (TPR) repeat protein
MQAQQRPQRLRFGGFELDLQSGELRKNRQKVRLPEQPFQVLAFLLERKGALVTREELRQRLWGGDTFIDFDDGLNAAVKRLRQALNDSADKPKFVETIPRRGYRLLCPVEELAKPAQGPTSSDGNLGIPPIREISAEVDVEGGNPVEPLISRSHPYLHKKTIIASVAALVLLAAVAAVRTSHKPRLSERDYIVLTDFKNDTSDGVFDETLKEAIAIDLGQSPYFNVYPEQKVRQALKFMGRSPDAPVTAQIAREICQRNGIKAYLSGSIAKLGTHYVITLQASDSSFGAILRQEQVEADSKEQVLKTLGKASRSLRESLGESLVSIQQFGIPLEEATTSSLEALKVFTLGDIQHSRREDLASIPLYQRAVELDPNFAIAYARLGTAYQNIDEAKLSHDYLEKAFRLKDHVSEREALYITAHYYAACGMMEKSIEAYELYKQIYPRDFIPYNNLAIKYLNLGRNDKAVENALGTIRLNPVFPDGYVVAAAAYLGMNRMSDAKGILNAALQQKVDGWSIHELLSRIASLEGDETAMEHENTLTRASPEGELTLIIRDAGTMASRGQLQKARELYGNAVERAKQLGLMDHAADSLLDKALMEAEVGYPRLAASNVVAALGLSRNPTLKVGAARVLASAGMHDRALSLINETAKTAPANNLLQSVFVPQVKAIIELHRKNPARSLELLASTSPYDLLDPLGRYDYANSVLLLTRGEAYLQTHRGIEAEHEFQRILSLRKTYNDDCIYPLAIIDLARTYAATGDSFRARSTFQEFFTLWQNADSDSWFLRQVKREYARLNQQKRTAQVQVGMRPRHS